MGLHANVGEGDIHKPHNWSYVNEVARLAATGFVSADRYKLALQTDDYTLWMLINHNPITWMQITPQNPENITTIKMPAIKATPGSIPAGKAIYIVGLDTDSGNAYIEIADADDAAKMPSVGIAGGIITDTVGGYVVCIGPVYEQDTSAWTPGTPLYVGIDGTGTLVSTRPTGFATKVQSIGYVLLQHATNGIVAATMQDFLDWPNLSEAYIPIGQAGGGRPTQRAWAHTHDSAAEGGLIEFGRNYQSAISTARSTTTSATMQAKAQLVTPALTGKFRVGWHAVIDVATVGNDVESQLYNVTDVATVGATQRRRVATGTLQQYACDGFAEVVFTGAAKTFEVQWRSPDGATTVGIQDARIEFWRVNS